MAWLGCCTQMDACKERCVKTPEIGPQSTTRAVGWVKLFPFLAVTIECLQATAKQLENYTITIVYLLANRMESLKPGPARLRKETRWSFKTTRSRNPGFRLRSDSLPDKVLRSRTGQALENYCTQTARSEKTQRSRAFAEGLRVGGIEHDSNYGLHWKQNCSFLTSLPLPRFELSHSIEVRTCYTD